MTRTRLVVLMLAFFLLPAALPASADDAPAHVWTREMLVEGHTVFAVLEPGRAPAGPARDAGKPADVVVEGSAYRGVTWFNDQFLTRPGPEGTMPTPGSAAVAVLVREPSSSGVRYPCGGAVIVTDAVEHAYWSSVFDPRVSLVTVDGEDPVTGERAVHEPGSDVPYSMLDVNTTQPRVSTAATTLPSRYDHSLVVTDPNDRAWIVDAYTALEVTWVDPAIPGVHASTWTEPFWVVNVGGGAFVPDDGVSSCAPVVDDPLGQGAAAHAFREADARACATTTDAGAPVCASARGPGTTVPVPLDALDAAFPAIGYYAPTDAGWDHPSRCYDGRPNPGVPAGRGCPATVTPRTYNALLHVPLGPDHVGLIGNAPHAATDANGCESATLWSCPSTGSGWQAEGYSHPFNPAGIWQPGWTRGIADPFGGGWIDPWEDGRVPAQRACSTEYDLSVVDADGNFPCRIDEHDRHPRGAVNVHYSPQWRPPEPPQRSFLHEDVTGSLDVWHENNRHPDLLPFAPPYHPGQK